MLLLYSAGAYLGIFPGGYPTMPDPVALTGSGQRSARLADPTATPAPEFTAVAAALPPTQAALAAPTLPPPTAMPTAVPTAAPPTPIPVLPLSEAADHHDRSAAARAGRPGVPVKLVIPSIGVDTEVKPAGLVPGPNGQPEWETLPFVAVNYTILGPVGAPGNPVVAGHVVTLYEGNVFRNLYQVGLGDAIEVFTDDSHFTYQVDEIKLVEPDDVTVMEPTDDARLTLITCGGTFNPRTRTFSERLIVIGKLAGGERL